MQLLAPALVGAAHLEAYFHVFLLIALVVMATFLLLSAMLAINPP